MFKWSQQIIAIYQEQFTFWIINTENKFGELISKNRNDIGKYSCVDNFEAFYKLYDKIVWFGIRINYCQHFQ